MKRFVMAGTAILPISLLPTAAVAAGRPTNDTRAGGTNRGGGSPVYIHAGHAEGHRGRPHGCCLRNTASVFFRFVPGATEKIQVDTLGVTTTHGYPCSRSTSWRQNADRRVQRRHCDWRGGEVQSQRGGAEYWADGQPIRAFQRPRGRQAPIKRRCGGGDVGGSIDPGGRRRRTRYRYRNADRNCDLQPVHLLR